MNNRLYYLAYKFLNYRANSKDPMIILDNLNYKDSEKIKQFLKFNHQIKFI